MALLAGVDDEAFYAERFDAVFKAEGKALPVTLLPGIGHIGLTLEPRAAAAAVAAVNRLSHLPETIALGSQKPQAMNAYAGLLPAPPADLLSPGDGQSARWRWAR